jgi:hypothetical protein
VKKAQFHRRDAEDAEDTQKKTKLGQLCCVGVFIMQGIIFYAGAISIFLSAHVVNAQTPPRPDLRNVVIETNRQELDNLLLRKPILTAEDKSAQQAVLKQINEDFKALQVLNNRLMTEAMSDGDLDYKSLSKVLSEMVSRASRLKSHLMLPKAEVEKQKESERVLDASAFKDSLQEFDKVVTSFSTNPILQKVNVMEVELAKQASRDLVLIIQQSSRLKKAATKLSK